MTNEQVWLTITSAVALVSLLIAVLARLGAARAAAQMRAFDERLAVLESPVSSEPAGRVDERAPSPHLVTRVDEEQVATAPGPAQRIEGRFFADIVARETVIKAAAWTRGLRRALAPETRNRIRFQMRQETRRAGRERKAEVKVAVREHRARSRAAAADLGATLGEDVA